MYAYSGLGQTAPPPKKQAVRPVRDPSLATMYPEEHKEWCRQAVAHGFYTGNLTCLQALAAGAPMTDLNAQSPLPGSEAAYSNTKLYVGIGIAVAVVGIGAYLLTR